MAGGKEELAAMLHGSVGQKDGFGLEGFGEEVKIKVGDTPMRVGLHCSMASLAYIYPPGFIACRFATVLFLAAILPIICHISFAAVRP